MSSRQRAMCKHWNSSRGFGFLISEDNEEIFVHFTDCEGFVPEKDMALTFEKGKDKFNRPKAIRVKVSGSVSTDENQT